MRCIAMIVAVMLMASCNKEGAKSQALATPYKVTRDEVKPPPFIPEPGHQPAAGAESAGGDCSPRPTVSASDPNHARYEQPQADNACTVDADCVATGCSGEACVSRRAKVATTCEVIALPAGECGCVSGQCIWHVDPCKSEGGGRTQTRP